MTKTSKPTPDLPSLEWIRAFEAAGRRGNFTSAAQEQNLTQAAISQRIRLLEEHLGIRLFIRKSRGVELTAEGEAYLPNVQAALNGLRRSTADLFGRARQKIRIAAPVSLSSLWIAPRLPLISKHMPGVEISISSVHRRVDFATQKGDFEAHFGDGNWPDRRAWELFREELVPACAANLLKAGQDWRVLPRIVIAGPRAGWRDWGERFNTEIPSGTVLHADSFSIGLQACLAGAGTILASKPLCAPLFRSGRLVELSDHVLEMTAGYWLTNNPSVVMNRQFEQVMKIMCQQGVDSPFSN